MVKSSFIRRFNTDVKMLHDSGITAKAGACIMVILLSVGVASADRLETVDSPGQSLRGGECTYTLVGESFGSLSCCRVPGLLAVTPLFPS